MGLDFSPMILFGSTTSDLSYDLTRGVNSKNDQHVQKFCKQVVTSCNAKQLDKRLTELALKNHLLQNNLAELELIDRQLTKILLWTNNQCCPLSTAPWSPMVQMAYLMHHYWALQLTAKQTERNLDTALKKIVQCLDPILTAKDPNRSISLHLRQAQKQLKQAHKEAAEHCKEHLDALAKAANQQKKPKALKYMIRAKRNCQCYARFCQHTKPKSAGGLAFVTVTQDDGMRHPLLGHDELENTLLEYSQTHFARAEGSPFMQEPLKHLLQYDGLTSFGNRVTNGWQIGNIHNFDEPTKAILENLCRTLQKKPSHQLLTTKNCWKESKNGLNGPPRHPLDDT